MSLGSICGPRLVAMLVLGTGTPSISQLDLVAAAHVQHVVRDVGAGNVIGDHRHAVGAVGAGSLLDVHAVRAWWWE